MDKTIADTFNAFWALRYGKEQKNINYRLLASLCRAEKDPDLKDFMKDVMTGFKPLIDKDDTFKQADWEQMVDIADGLYKKYIWHREAFPIIAEICMYLDWRETKSEKRNKYSGKSEGANL